MYFYSASTGERLTPTDEIGYGTRSSPHWCEIWCVGGSYEVYGPVLDEKALWSRTFSPLAVSLWLPGYRLVGAWTGWKAVVDVASSLAVSRGAAGVEGTVSRVVGWGGIGTCYFLFGSLNYDSFCNFRTGCTHSGRLPARCPINGYGGGTEMCRLEKQLLPDFQSLFYTRQSSEVSTQDPPEPFSA